MCFEISHVFIYLAHIRQIMASFTQCNSVKNYKIKKSYQAIQLRNDLFTSLGDNNQQLKIIKCIIAYEVLVCVCCTIFFNF